MDNELLLFDEPYYIEVNEARWVAANKIIAHLGLSQNFSCLDVACGPGWFSQKLSSLTNSVTGTDVRQELLDVAAERVPTANFLRADIDTASFSSLVSPQNLVFCFGLLYHIENPFAAIRKMAAMTDVANGHLLIESRVCPVAGGYLQFVNENVNSTQGASSFAIVPSRDVMVGMLHAVGFSHVFRYTDEIDHSEFQASSQEHKKREIYLGTNSVLDLPFLALEDPRVFGKIDFSR